MAGVATFFVLVTTSARGFLTHGRLERRLPETSKKRWRLRAEEQPQPLEPHQPLKKGATEAGSTGFLPRGDALDGRIVKLAVPAVANFVILPLVGTVDTFFVGQLGDAQALAALGAANQVFSSVFFVVSFLPSVVTPLVAAANAAGDKAQLRERVREAMWVSALVGTLASVLLASMPASALKLVLPAAASEATWRFGEAYLGVRALTLAPAMIAFVGFATFRGLLDVVTPLKISCATQSLNVILDPILIFGAKLGVTGAALATGASEIASAFLYARLLALRGIVEWSSRKFWTTPPSPAQLAPLLGRGAGVLARSIAMNAAFLSVTRCTQSLDPTGALAAAHTISMQTWQLGGVVLFALSAVASILVPAKLNAPETEGGGPVAAKRAADRILGWGLTAGAGLAIAQLALLPLLNVFTPDPAVRQAARAPAAIGAVLQLINGLTFCGEGIMQGHAAFFRLALSSFVASAAMIAYLNLYASSLVQVWLGFGLFNLIRFVGAMHHHFIAGPLAPSRLNQPRVFDTAGPPTRNPRSSPPGLAT